MTGFDEVDTVRTKVAVKGISLEGWEDDFPVGAHGVIIIAGPDRCIVEFSGTPRGPKGWPAFYQADIAYADLELIDKYIPSRKRPTIAPKSSDR